MATLRRVGNNGASIQCLPHQLEQRGKRAWPMAACCNYSFQRADRRANYGTGHLPKLHHYGERADQKNDGVFVKARALQYADYSSRARGSAATAMIGESPKGLRIDRKRL